MTGVQTCALPIYHHQGADEVVHNGAEFSEEAILWARSMGAKKDSELCQAYRGRTFWSLTTDDSQASLRPLDLCRARE